ncbi:MAG: hypothetical protein KDD66_06460 [Bdellovibrionales bacterium]|nr:hypothetical protein [Bdellovibrionales bacterium]
MIKLIIAIAALALTAALAPLPLAPEVNQLQARIYLAAFLAAAACCAALGSRATGRLFTDHTATKLGCLLAALSMAISYYCLKTPLPLAVAGASICLIVFALAAFVRHEAKIAFSAAVGLLLVAACAMSVEATLRRVPEMTLAKEVRQTPPLVQPDQVNIVYKKNWFRGKRPCVDCPKDNIRIITLGGSSTYGVPMYYGSLSYTQSLQRFLDERRPGEHYEVLNAGVAAYGITQVIAALKEELLKYNPTIVTVCSWFNDSAPNNRWYQTPGISDWEAYERHRALQRLGEFPLYKKVRASKLFALSRWSLLGLKSALFAGSGGRKSSAPAIPRMNPDEFRWGLEEVVRLGEEHNFLPVFVLEAMHRPDSLKNAKRFNEYFKQIYAVAEKNDLPVVDTISPLHQVADLWTFHDFIHPNSVGHRIIAEAMYHDLIAEPATKRTRKFLEARGVDFGKPDVRLEIEKHLLSDALAKDGLDLNVRAPYLDNSPGRLEVTINNSKSYSFDGLSAEFKKFSIPPADFNTIRPLTDIRASAVIDRSNNPQWAIGSTGLYSPVLIDATSGGKNFGWRVLVTVDGQRIDSDGRGYNVSVIDAVQGDVLKQKHFDTFGAEANATALLKYIEQLETTYPARKLIVVVAVKTDGRHNVNKAALGNAFKSLGGSGELPQAMESFLLIGTPGAAPGTAVEEMGRKLVHKIIGSTAQEYARLLEEK